MGLLRGRSDELRSLGVEPYGVSRDSPWTHVAWQQALDLNFELLSDWNADAIHAFGIAHEFGEGLREVAERTAFLVDRDGVVRRAWHYGTSEVPDLDELVEAARGLEAATASG
ncbi:MAG TPA: redoxin domain-containing protein [Gaiellaceae bacterium]|jgi:peroxiredoxin